MFLRPFILAFLVFSSLPSFSAVVGWFVYVDLSLYQCSITGYSQETGLPLYSASYTGAKCSQCRYFAGSTPPTYASLGLTRYADLAGNFPPSNARFEYAMWLVSDLKSFAVDDSVEGADFSALGDLTASHLLTPLYDWGAGAYAVLNGANKYIGKNLDFGQNGMTIIQGQISPDNDNGVPSYYYYDPNGSLVLTDNPSSNMGTFTYDSSSGSYSYTPLPSDSSSSSVDLSPVVDAINNQGGLTRSQLVSLLGSNGNSWVYDCSLSLDQLYNLAINSGLIVQVAQNPQLDDIHSAIFSSSDDQKAQMALVGNSIVSAIEGIDVSPVVNVAAPVVNIDTSSLAKETTLSRGVDYLDYISSFTGASQSELEDLNSKISSLRSIFQSWNQNNNISYSPADFGDTTPDQELPSGFQDSASSFPSSVSQTLGTLTDWGDNGVPSAFDFNPISGLLNTFVGSIPSVGSDATILEVDFDLPYIGQINRVFRWSDFPYISEFRQFLLWCLYVFFGIACFKLIHKSIF